MFSNANAREEEVPPPSDADRPASPISMDRDALKLSSNWWHFFADTEALGKVLVLRWNKIRHWKNYVHPSNNSFAIYQIPCTCHVVVRALKARMPVLYTSNEGCVYREHGIYRLVSVAKKVHCYVDAGAQRRFVDVFDVCLAFERETPFEDGKLADFLTRVTPSNATRSAAEARHQSLITESILPLLGKMTGTSWRASHETLTFHNKLFNYTPDFFLHEDTTRGDARVFGGRIVVESKTSYYGLAAPGVRDKIKLVLEHGHVVVGVYDVYASKKTHFAIFKKISDYDDFLSPRSFPVHESAEAFVAALLGGAD